MMCVAAPAICTWIVWPLLYHYAMHACAMVRFVEHASLAGLTRQRNLKGKRPPKLDRELAPKT